ncbi:MAG: low molecular weight phosphotyrosine protein phosphatase [Nannocystaceae bacterium]|nr:low molecular weight phosphotyrosine protein phosphatase [Nannocystaceae bacterium]
MDASRIGVLFVCHANMCRSPLAHGLFVHRAQERGVLEKLDIDSAGTWAADGIAPHAGSVHVAAAHGLSLGSAGVSRSLRPTDLQRFAQIIVMDRANLADVERFRRLSAFGAVQGGQARVRLLRTLDNPHARGADLDVPDPVRGGEAEFHNVYGLVDRGCQALLDELHPR